MISKIKLLLLPALLISSCVNSRMYPGHQDREVAQTKIQTFHLDQGRALTRFNALKEKYNSNPTYGPNCWNVTLYLHGYTNIARYVDYSEILNFFNSANCNQHGNYPLQKPREGLISSYSRDKIKHADFVINNGWSLHKPGPGVDELYLKENTSKIISYNSETYHCVDENCYFYPKIDYYKCKVADEADGMFLMLKSIRDALATNTIIASEAFRKLQQIGFNQEKYIVLETLLVTYEIEKIISSAEEKIKIASYRKKLFNEINKQAITSKDIEILSSVVSLEDILYISKFNLISKMDLRSKYLIIERVAAGIYQISYIYNNKTGKLEPIISKNQSIENLFYKLIGSSSFSEDKAALLFASYSLFRTLFGSGNLAASQEMLDQCKSCQYILKNTIKLSTDGQNSKFLYEEAYNVLGEYKLNFSPYYEQILNKYKPH